MKKLIVILILAISTINSCEKDPCDQLVKGIYLFPDLPVNHSMTSQQIHEFWDLPEDIGGCISTEGLIETCLNYPDLGLIWTRNSPQLGYDYIKSIFKGLGELEARKNRGVYLLKKYQKLDPVGYNPDWTPLEIGNYMFSIYHFEIIFSQYCNLKPLTKNEQIAVMEMSISIYDQLQNDIEKQGSLSLGIISTLMGRLMYQNNYEPFMLEYANNNLIGHHLNSFMASTGTTLFIYNLSKEYLAYLRIN